MAPVDSDRPGAVSRIDQHDARMRVLRGNRLVPEVEADALAAGPAHDARQQHRRGQERKIRQVGPVAGVPQHGGPRAQLHAAPARVDGKRRRSPGDHARHGQPIGLEVALQRLDRGEPDIRPGRARGHVRSRTWPSYACSPPGDDALDSGDRAIQGAGAAARRNSGAVHADVQIERAPAPHAHPRRPRRQSTRTAPSSSAITEKRVAGYWRASAMSRATDGPTG